MIGIYMKRVISVLLALLMLFSFAACMGAEKNGARDNKQSYKLLQNNIKTETIVYESAGEYSNSEYFEISGLKNEEVQNKINESIKSEFFKMYNWEDMPKYRGLQLELKNWEGIDPYYKVTNAYPYCNLGNILSVVVSGQKNFEKPDDRDYDWLFLDARNSFNYDLNTGELIKIADVFKDGVDGIKYINDCINKALNNSDASEEEWYYGDDYNTFKLVGEFTGISEDQKYFIDAYGDTLYLILDDETPWAKLNDFSTGYFSVDISGLCALESGFVKDDIYTDNEKSYILLKKSFDDNEKIEEYSAQDDYMGIPGLYYEENLGYSSAMPEYQIEAIKQYVEDGKIAGEKYISENISGDAFDRSGNIVLMVNASRFGKYTNINFYRYFSVYSNYLSYEDFYDSSYENYYLVFEEGREQALAIEDLFVPGYDFSSWEFDPHEYSFELTADTIYFSNNADFRSMSYKEIGCDNLTIFE